MVKIKVENLSLTYRLRRKLSLAASARRPGGHDRITGQGRTRYVTALDNISFELSPGDRLGLVGKNGSGKTTLLKAVYGVFPPTSGTVCTEGRVDALFNISLGFRREATGRRNIVLRALINGWSEAEINERMDEIIEFSELGGFIDFPLKSYSAGMAARLAFSVATAMEPEILLMDEWIGAGDPAFQRKARQRMNDLAENAGIIMLASHSHGLLRRVCNKILELNDGKLVRLVSVDEFFSEEGVTD